LLPYGIVVNAIAPGPTATPMLGKTAGSSISEPNNPSKRYAMPEEIASMAVYMVSDAGRMIVGDTVYMTGGSGTITLHH
ncbi:MAG TPA: oxidoreductase, partial [Lachnospiraceae bacterium]|nr:oxidoreductase [Lachnospiraceae bacterium]